MNVCVYVCILWMLWSKPTYMHLLVSTGLVFFGSLMTGRCQLCRNHRSRYRRECIRCFRLVASGCNPEQCWCEESQICRRCAVEDIGNELVRILEPNIVRRILNFSDVAHPHSSIMFIVPRWRCCWRCFADGRDWWRMTEKY